jgi:hypothetical protein
MLLRSLIALLAIAALTATLSVPQAAAQSAPNLSVGEPPVPVVGGQHQRIEIHPRRLLYRRCTDWYELQYRPSGTVLYPQKHCWWVRG